MKIEVLGCFGGKTDFSNLPSFLIDDKFLVDCGSVCSVLPLNRQLGIETVFVSHAHFDHICDLPFLADNFSIANKKLLVYASEPTVELLKSCVFNNKMWPDFAAIPNKENPVLCLNSVKEGDVVKIGDYSVEFFNVFHTRGSIGFIFRKGENCLAYTSDTFKSNGLWEKLQNKGVKTLITECSFPSEREKLAEISRHFSVSHFAEEIKKMNGFEKIYIFHTKPHYREKIEKELTGLNVFILKDGDIIEG